MCEFDGTKCHTFPWKSPLAASLLLLEKKTVIVPASVWMGNNNEMKGEGRLTTNI